MKTNDEDVRRIIEWIRDRNTSDVKETKTLADEYTRWKVEQSFKETEHEPSEQDVVDAIKDRENIFAALVRGVFEAWREKPSECLNPNIDLFITDGFLDALKQDNREKEVTMTNGTIIRGYPSLNAFCDEQGFNRNTVGVSLHDRGSYKGWRKAS